MLHIVRHYKPFKVILFLSKEMGEREKKSYIYSRAINSIDDSIDIEFIFTEIEKAHDFNVYVEIVPELLRDVSKRYPDSQILINGSSGTPQMINAFNLYATASERNWKVLQVLTPENGSNTSPVVKKTFDFDLEITNNLDTDPLLETENRIVEIDLTIYRKMMVYQQIKKLISVYNYDACCTLLENEKIHVNEKVVSLLRHAQNRMRFKFADANVALKNTYQDLRVIGGPDRELIEYFNMLSVHLESGNIDLFIVMLININQYLMESYLQKRYKINIDDTREKVKGEHYLKGKDIISEEKFKALYTQYYNEGRKFKHGFATNEFEFLFNLIGDFERNNKSRWFNLFEKVKQYKDLRNAVAHTLRVLEIKESETFSNFRDEVKSFLNKYHKKSIKKFQLRIYDEINDRIYEELN